MPNDDYELVHDSATTNTTPGSKVYVDVNTTPICPNMTNKEFKALIIRLRNTALALIGERIADVARWDKTAQDRAQFWFGRKDSTIREILSTGLPKLAAAMRELQPEKVVKWDEQKGMQITCATAPDIGINDAAVCKPDSTRRIIAFYPHFCTVDDVFVSGNCKLKILIHECSHYVDTFNSEDVSYGFAHGVGYWAQTNPDGASKNADSIACYIAHFEDMDEFRRKKIW
ncbi:hypothetical protein G3O06_07815 [Burkholderia sp. Ac-20345]|uniref:M35 family metallo-endopeptidase n=1 Tax=Burkholderia sp. Ac-20345 TaxID=2703891 RepID=UPI00197C748B|nr:M35 family metallo-endopeptidase [Burkholderia sp. Ac-20345]MBN3777457.1 hypothetical protein [Burkholderia sp. Ac-20345]